mmetsp:Transcript_2692/g.8222  ORF Transcript_2692/g.8222 Transcript_2692/m.8222 type:complete len:309 (+) Transcript_2692:811-1737(+)
MLTAAGHTTQGAALLKSIQRMDVLSAGRPTAAWEGDTHIRPAQRDEIQSCRVPVLVCPHCDDCVLPSKTQVIHLTRAEVLACGLIARAGVRSAGRAAELAPAVEPHFGIIAAQANEIGADIAAVDGRIGHLEAFPQTSCAGINDLHAGLPAMCPARRLGHCDDLLVGGPEIHREARRVMQPNALHLEERPLASATALWEPAVAIEVQGLRGFVGVQVGGAAPARQAEEAPDLVAEAQVMSTAAGRQEPDDGAGAEALVDQNAQVLGQLGPTPAARRKPRAVLAARRLRRRTPPPHLPHGSAWPRPGPS